MGGQAARIAFASRPPTVVMLVGAAGLRQDDKLREVGESPAQAGT